MTQQTNSFGTPEKNPLVLEEPSAEVWADMTNLLISRCTKVQLLSYATALTPWFEQYDGVMRASKDGCITEATEALLMLKSSSSKNTIAQGLALVVASEDNLCAYVNSLSEEMRSLWAEVLFNIYITQKEAKAILKTGEELLSSRNRYYYYDDQITWNKREYSWFATERLRSAEVGKYNFRDYESYITVTPTVHALFFPVFFPEAFDSDISFSELPGGSWRTISFETDSYKLFHLFCGLMRQNAFPLKSKGFNIADLKRAQKKMAMDEFFPGDKMDYRANLRVYDYMQLMALCLLFITKNEKLSYEDTVKQLAGNFNRIHYYITYLLYPHIKGFRRQIMDQSRDDKLCQTMLTILREEPEGWMSIRDIFLKVYASEQANNSVHYTNMVFHPQNETYSTELTNSYSGHVIAANSYVTEFGFTGLQSFSFMLASIGMLEIAVCEERHRGMSPFDTLGYVRLTPLGRYALGIDKTYEAPKQEQTAYFELDPKRLIIRSLVSPNPYAQMLKDTSIPISKDRFETSALSFLANCYKRSDVVDKISIFRQFISSELPPLWEQFFQQLLQHCHPLMEDRTSYKRYTISPENRDLIQLITTDPVLRPLIVLAEGYRILVKTEDLKKFEMGLKKHGYLL